MRRVALFFGAAAMLATMPGCFLFGDECEDLPPPERIQSDDRDEDGFADSDDCAPDDPSRSPGAIDIADDGIDQDCDGFDRTETDLAAACGNARPGGFTTNAGDTSNSIARVPSICGTGQASVVYWILPQHENAQALVTLSVVSDTPHAITVRYECSVNALEIGCAEPGAPVQLVVPPNTPIYVAVNAIGEPGPFELVATGEPLVCSDKYVASSEECDDGNLIDGDGCSAGCKLE